MTGLRTDAFGGAPAATSPSTPSPAPAASSPAANASPPAAQVNTPAPAPAPKAAEPHMPKVGTVTADNPTGAILNAPALDEQKAKLKETVTGLGQAMGAGVNSLGELAILVCQSARDGIIVADSKSEDVADLYNAFNEASNKSRVDYDPSLAKLNSAKVQVSKLRQFAKLGAMDAKFDAAKVLARARDVIPKVQGIKVSTYTALIMVAREHIAMVKKDPKAKAMNDAAIKALLTPEVNDVEVPDNERELRELEAIAKRIVKLCDGTDEVGPRDSSEARKAYEIINGRILFLRESLAAAEPAGDDA